VQKCTAKLTDSPITTTSSVVAVLSRGKVVYATGSSTNSRKRVELTLVPGRSIGRGSYTLTLTWGRKRQRETIIVA
jgi:hypothetical protein